VISLRQKPQDNTREVLVLNTTDGEEVFSMQADNEAGHGDRLAVAYNSKYGGLGVGYGSRRRPLAPTGEPSRWESWTGQCSWWSARLPFVVRFCRDTAVRSVPLRSVRMERDWLRWIGAGGIRIWDVAGPPRASLNEQSKSLDRLDWCEKFCVSRDGGLVVWLGKHQVAEDECRLNAMNLRTAEGKTSASSGPATTSVVSWRWMSSG